MPIPGTITFTEDRPLDVTTLSFLAQERDVPVPFGEATAARIGRSFRSTIIYSLFRQQQMEAALRDEPIAKFAEVQKRIWKNSTYFREGLEWRPDMTWEYARLLAFHHDRNIRIQGRLERGPNGFRGFVSGALGITGAFADPINFIPIVQGAKSLNISALLARGFGNRAAGVLSRSVIRPSGSLRLVSNVSKAIAKATGQSTANTLNRKAFTRAGILAFEAAVTEAAAQPVIAMAAELSQEPFDTRMMFMNIGMALGVGSAFGAVGASVHRWGMARRVRGLQSALESYHTDRPIDVREAVGGDSGATRAAPNPVLKQELTLRDRLLRMPDNVVNTFADAQPTTPSGSRIKELFNNVRTMRAAIESLGPDAEFVTTARGIIDDILKRNPNLNKVVDDIESFQSPTADMIDNFESGFGKYGRPAREVLPEFSMKKIAEDSPVVAERIKARAETMLIELQESEPPTLRKTTETISGKTRSKSTVPQWMQDMRYESRVFNNNNQLKDALVAIIEGTDDNIPARLKVVRRTVPAVKEQIIKDLSDGVDSNDAPLWTVTNGSDAADEAFRNQLRVLDGNDVVDDAVKFATIEELDFPDTPSIARARGNIAQDAGREVPIDDLAPDELDKIIELDESDLRKISPEEFEGKKIKNAELQKADIEVKQSRAIEEAYDFASNCLLKGLR